MQEFTDISTFTAFIFFILKKCQLTFQTNTHTFHIQSTLFLFFVLQKKLCFQIKIVHPFFVHLY